MPVTDSVFLLAESREHPTHVGGLQLFSPPPGADPDYVSTFYRELLGHTEVARVMRRRPCRSPLTFGQWAWAEDPEMELDYHVRLSGLARPGRVRELLELVSRLHGTLLDRHRPLWEMHVIEGLKDGRFAVYTKVHHALMDGVSVVARLGQGLSEDPDEKSYPPWAPSRRRRPRHPSGSTLTGTLRQGVGLTRDAVGLPPALARTLVTAARDHEVKLPYQAPDTMFNVRIGGARRFAGQGWPLSRVRAVGKAADATINDVALAMCSGALRRYLLEHGALPDDPLIAMVPVSLRTKRGGGDSTGNAVGAMLCDLATDEADPGLRLARVRASSKGAKAMLAELTPAQILAFTAMVMAGLVVGPVPLLGEVAPQPFNLIISNVPGSRAPLYWSGAELQETYPLSIPMDGQAVNITLTSHLDHLAFGIVGCRRSVPHLQRLLGHLGSELDDLERAVA
jgi:WS/DGAT/MGAT family acyltransferase